MAFLTRRSKIEAVTDHLTSERLKGQAAAALADAGSKAAEGAG